jgi:DNA helicase-2/ATP-dependent DNA helicase PcrA
VKLFQNFSDVLERYQKRWRFILIDEYQDTNLAQYTLIKLLAEKHQNVFAVGDPDQSIYSWRGADVHNILNFEKNFPGAKIIALEQNYRSKSNILAAANLLIEENAGRYKKHLWSDRGEGEKIGLFLAKNEHEETAFVVERIKKHHQDHIALSECVIFYRTHFQSRTFEDALLRARIPYVIIGGLSFYQRKEIKDILALLRLVLGGADFLSFSRTINLPKRGIGEKALASLKNYAQERGRDIFSACKELVEKREGVKLSERQYSGLKSYIEMIDFLREISKHGSKLRDLVSYAIERSSYLEVLKRIQRPIRSAEKTWKSLFQRRQSGKRRQRTHPSRAF